MSGHRRVFIGAFLLSAGLTIAPASSNPLADLFNPASKDTAAPAPASPSEECLSQPGKPTAPDKHWVYRLNGHRKCWFEADATVSVNRRSHHHVTKERAVALKENDGRPRRNALLDARAQLASGAPDEAPQSVAPAPASAVADTVSEPGHGTGAMIPAAPISARRTIDRLTPDRASPPAGRVGPRLVEASLDTPKAGSSASAAAADPSVPGADEDGRGLTATPVGAVLIALGFVLLAGSLASRFPNRAASLVVRRR